MRNVLDKNRFFAKFKNVILTQFGEEEGNTLWKHAGKISADLLDRHPKAVPDAKNVAYPMAGIYLALQEKVSKEEARRLMMDYAPSAGEDVKRQLAKLTGFPGLPKLIWRHREAIMRSAGSEKKGYKSKIVDVDEESVTMYVYACPIHETLKELGMPEIAPVMCAIDKIYTTGIRGVRYHRQKSVAEGDEYCDYYITREALPESREYQ